MAAFDFDGTFTNRDSLLPFLHFVAGNKATLKNLFLEVPHLLQYLLGRLDRQGLKERFLSRFLKNKDQREIQNLAEKYAQQILPKMVRPKGLEKIAWHKSHGHICLLVSANLDVYLVPWGKGAGFDDVIASRLDFSSNETFTGHLIGQNCRGHEKVKRLMEVLGPKENYILYAYGDSEGDRELLDLADYAFYRTFE